MPDLAPAVGGWCQAMALRVEVALNEFFLGQENLPCVLWSLRLLSYDGAWFPRIRS
jgi:hypothetical protein